MTRKLMILFAAVAAAIGARAATETVGDYTWTYWNYGSGAEVAGVEPAMGTVTIPSTLGGSPVTKVGNSAFSGRSSLTGVSIPSSVTSIEARAFYGCSGLRNVAMPVSVKTLGDGVFQNCTGLESVSIPVSVTAIPYNAFYGCTSLRTLDLPVTVKSIGSYAFYSCISLSSVSIPFSVKSIGDYSFYGCSSLSNLELSNGLETIGYEAFYGCNGLREVVIPASVTSVSSYAFDACGNIRRVTVPGCVLSNMFSVFGDSCKTITSLTIAEGVESIDSGFYNCDGLTSLSIPASVTRIGESVFRYSSCPALTEITVAPGNANYKFSGGLLLTKDGKEIVAVPRGRTWVSIPDTVTKIGRETFNNCPNLNFTWRNGVKSIDGWVLGCDEDDLPKNFTLSGYRGIANGAFSYCEALTGITIGEGVKSIGAYSFEECSNLTSISIPASVTHIDDSAFDGCYRISSINLSSGNKNYKYTGGLLVSADNTELVAASRTATSVKIPEGVSSVRNGFFAGCAKLTSVTFPSSVEEIGDEGSVFGGWEEIEDNDDWYYKFHGSPALKTITVVSGNQYYKSVNGLLLGMDDGELFLKAVPQSLTSVNVPEGVRWLSSYSFVGCSKLTAVTFPRSLYEYDGELYYNDDEDDIDESSGPYKLTAINVAAWNEEYSSANGLLLSADGTEIYEVPRGLTSVTIPASVTDIDVDDFEYCKKLKSFSVENGNKEFSAVNGMLLTKDGKELVCVPSTFKSQRTITIPAGVTRIGRHAFSYFGQLTSIVIPEGVVEIGNGAFSGCESLAKVTLPSTLKRIGESVFLGCALSLIKIPNGMERIGWQAFATYRYSSNMCIDPRDSFYGEIADTNSVPGFVLVDGWLVGVQRSLEYDYFSWTEQTYTDYINEALQDSRIRGIADGAFQDCSGLRYVALPSCMKYVGDYLFANCPSLEWVDIPEGVIGIGQYAFQSCYNLSGITIPDSVRCVAQNAFQGCRFIDGDSLPGLQLVDGWIMRDVGVSSQLAEDDSFEGTYVISGEQGIRGIADSAFASGRNVCCGSSMSGGLRGVTSLVIDDGVMAIGSRSFANCDDLTNIHVAASVKYIGEEAFYDCRSLKSVQLPDTLKGKIPESVFAKCPNSLKITYYEAPRPVHVVDFYDNYSAHTEYVHAGSSSVDRGKRCDVRNGQWNYDEGLHVWTLAVSVPNGRLQSFWITGMTENSNVRLIDVEGRYSYKEDGETYEGYMYPSEWKTIANHNGGVNEFIRLTEADWSYVPASVKYVTFTITVTGTNDSAEDEDCQFYFDIGKTSNDFPDDDNMIPIHYSGWLGSREVEEGRAIGELPEISRDQCRFLGWFTAPDGGEKVSAMTLMGESDVAYYAHWWCYGDVFEGVGLSALDEDDNIVVTLTNDVSGTVEIPDNVGAVTIDLNGHNMVGDGGHGVTALPSGPAIRIVKGEGEGETTQLAIGDTSDGEKGQIAGGGESAGIEIAEDAAQGVRLDVDDAVPVLNGDGTEQDCSLLGKGYPPWPTDGAYNPLVANVYDGYIVDGDGALAGIIQVKAAKQAVKTATDKKTKLKTVTTNVTVTATVTDAAGKKWSYKGDGTVDGVVTGLVCTTKGVLVPSFGVTLGANGLEGEWGDFAVEGARSGMGTKGDAMMAALDASYKKSWSVTLTNGLGATRLQLVVGAKGSTKISGVTPDGFKISATVQGIMGEDAFFVPYLTTLKNGKLTRSANLLLTLGKDGAVVARTSDLGALKAGGHTTDEIEVQTYSDSESSKGGEAYAGAVVLNDLAYPAKFAAKGLPAGLKIDAATGAITGVPTNPGRYTATITVTSGVNGKKKVETKVDFDIANYTDDAIDVEDSYSGYCVGVMVCEPIAGALDCAVSELPAGLKFAAKETKDNTFGMVAAGTVYGVPTKAGEYTVYFKKTEKVNGKSVKRQASATFKVEALPAWAQGTFDGNVECKMENEELEEMCGTVTLTVDAKGKISGKLIDADGTWTLSAAAYSSVESLLSDVEEPPSGSQESEVSSPAFHATVIGKSGKKAITNEVTVASEEVAAAVAGQPPYRRGVVNALAARSTSGTGGSPVQMEWTAWQNLWKQDSWKAKAKSFANKKLTLYVVDVGEKGRVVLGAPPEDGNAHGTIELKFGASGAVTAGGKFVTGQNPKTGKDIVYSASCSVVLVPDAARSASAPYQGGTGEIGETGGTGETDGTFSIYLYFPPKAGKFDGYAVEIPLVWENGKFILTNE